MRLHNGGRGVNGGNGFWDYPKVNLQDPQLLATTRKVTCVVAANNEWEKVDKGAGIEIETTDGRVIREIVPFSKGLPENPMSADEVREKFRSLVDPILPQGQPQALIETVESLEKLKDIDELVKLLLVPANKRFTAVAGGRR
jgi:2-methylcitrate dehydratase PrpD